GISQLLLQSRDLAFQALDLLWQSVQLPLLLVGELGRSSGRAVSKILPGVLPRSLRGRSGLLTGIGQASRLAHRISEAARVFLRAPLPVQKYDGGAKAVEKVPIVGDQNERALVVVQHLDRGIEGRHVQVVG